MCRRFLLVAAVAFLSSWTLGCGNGVEQPAFDALHPVTGKLTRGGMPAGGGMVRFNPIPDKQEFIINSLVETDGTFKLTTVRTTDTQGERRDGAPIGEYTVVYMPPVVDQTIAHQDPISLPQKVVIEAKDNQLTIELPTGK
ncbi:hypothetical protein NA78x_005283 [Anatilimnocola sp. NA78]|uniref:hypothetical protein n=1 Tax=Anatilimnocola sp. NA78 TaxID=3415683 RepID=UPI003CE5BD69